MTTPWDIIKEVKLPAAKRATCRICKKRRLCTISEIWGPVCHPCEVVNITSGYQVYLIAKYFEEVT